MAHGVECFARLVRLLLGPDAVAESKVESGADLCILGISVSMDVRGVAFRLEQCKAQRWQRDIQRAMETMRLLPGCASKLSGRLSWAYSKCFIVLVAH